MLVFFFANARGARLAEQFPALAALGGPIFVATGLFMVATAMALAASWLLTRTLPIMPLVSGIVVFVFGALTLWLQDDVFIKMKPTIVNTLFGVVLLGGLLFGRSLLGYVFDRRSAWTRRAGASSPCAGGCSSCSWRSLNEVIWRSLDRYLGRVQGLGHHAAHATVHA